MAITVITTPMAANANSYISVSDADTYHETRLHVSDWTSASSDEKAAALVWATRLLDEKIEWVGSQTDEDGALRWPRENVYDKDGNELDDETIPTWLAYATAEYARYLAAEDDTSGFKKIKVGSLEIQPLPSDRTGTVPSSVWSMIKYYGQVYGSGTRYLVRA